MNFKHFQVTLSNLPCKLNMKNLLVSMVNQNFLVTTNENLFTHYEEVQLESFFSCGLTLKLEAKFAHFGDVHSLYPSSWLALIFLRSVLLPIKKKQ